MSKELVVSNLRGLRTFSTVQPRLLIEEKDVLRVLALKELVGNKSSQEEVSSNLLPFKSGSAPCLRLTAGIEVLFPLNSVRVVVIPKRSPYSLLLLNTSDGSVSEHLPRTLFSPKNEDSDLLFGGPSALQNTSYVTGIGISQRRGTFAVLNTFNVIHVYKFVGTTDLVRTRAMRTGMVTHRLRSNSNFLVALGNGFKGWKGEKVRFISPSQLQITFYDLSFCTSRSFLTVDSSNSLRLWRLPLEDVTSNNAVQVRRITITGSKLVQSLPGNRACVLGYNDIQVWDLNTRLLLLKVELVSAGILSCRRLPQKDYLLLLGLGGSLKFSTTTGKVTTLSEIRGRSYPLAWSGEVELKNLRGVLNLHLEHLIPKDLVGEVFSFFF